VSRYNSTSPIVINAICKVITLLGKLQWPHDWPTFLADVLGLVLPSGSSSIADSTLPGVHLLMHVIEDLPAATRNSLSLPTHRISALKHQLSANLLEILCMSRIVRASPHCAIANVAEFIIAHRSIACVCHHCSHNIVCSTSDSTLAYGTGALSASS
jgi:hypothetical protein